MNRHIEALTQEEQDQDENGHGPCRESFYRICDHEPGCPTCKGTLVRKSVDTVTCCKCKEGFTGQMLAKFKININEIG